MPGPSRHSFRILGPLVFTAWLAKEEEGSGMKKQSVAKVIELVGSSDKSWSDAADVAVQTASRSIKNIGPTLVRA